jgi:hypothetical protein
MSCDRCGSNATGRLCADCEQVIRLEKNHEHRAEELAHESVWEDGEGDDD